MNNIDTNPLIALGLGIGIGVCALWILLEVWPLLMLSGAAYLVFKGMQQQATEAKETTT